jgi:hypothetical protein
MMVTNCSINHTTGSIGGARVVIDGTAGADFKAVSRNCFDSTAFSSENLNRLLFQEE